MVGLKNKKLLFTIIIYVFITTYLIILNSTIYTNFINPLFWGGMIIYLTIDQKRNYIRFNQNKKYLKNMLIISCIHVVIYLCMGLILGFSKTTNSYNFIATVIPIIGIEMARNVIATINKNNKLGLAFLTILLVLVELKYNILVNLYINKEVFFKYVCQTILPLIACNILCTYLTLKCSFMVPLVYRIFSKLIVLILPIYSNVDWFIIATTSILSPTIIYTLFKYKFTNKNENIRKKRQNFNSKIGFVVTFIFCINLVLFMIGIFKYESITIVSNSMKPNFERGDVVIFEKMSDSELKQISKNEIIVYSIGKQNIVHRIIDIIEKDDKISYLTKGDSNNVADKMLVQTNQIKGKYVFHIKYIGFPTVWLYEYFNR